MAKGSKAKGDWKVPASSADHGCWILYTSTFYTCSWLEPDGDWGVAGQSAEWA